MSSLTTNVNGLREVSKYCAMYLTTARRACLVINANRNLNQLSPSLISAADSAVTQRCQTAATRPCCLLQDSSILQYCIFHWFTEIQ